jgi:hypothetical protein
MPKGPQGQKRKADVIGNAVLVMKIATGEAKDTGTAPGTEANRKGGLKGGAARAAKLTPEERKNIAAHWALVQFQFSPGLMGSRAGVTFQHGRYPSRKANTKTFERRTKAGAEGCGRGAVRSAVRSKSAEADRT